MNELAEMISKGGPIVWVLAAYSVVGVAIVLERYFLFIRMRRLPQSVTEQLGQLLVRRDAQDYVADLKGPEARIIQGMIDADRKGVKDLARVGGRVRDDELQRMALGLRTLGVLSNTAPLLGLLGTITGLIKAFIVIEEAGGRVDGQALAGGIWEAMITTGVGLSVAIPLLILLHFLEGMVDRRAQSMEQSIALLLERRSIDADSIKEKPDAAPHWEEITDGV
ncbi:MotA/TolQ/ExbB proton channel family protein [Solemya velum gill symbiont]|uniref:Biopolymer transport protein ExbBD, subunit B2 n=2 Tax=Solemya velum gill symbiont TaxID=2340 RepID=A0A0B0H898_SOVGS|nr:MotA/TolQ/ExbB proton channel family protein [Solemya velum gill symbiont]KHF24847.1 biopolymer transport protein ExbBD, subunit B2 [Solemya velum gill symbiont]